MMEHSRQTHPASALDFDHPPPEPLTTLRKWWDAAHEKPPIPNPNAMSIATVDPDGGPSVRVVLCRGLDERGVAFYTNRASRKGLALRAHPRASCNFHWDWLDRQIRVEGAVTLTSDEESDAYWRSRPRANRIHAFASQQSQPIAAPEELERAVRAVEARFGDGDIPRPPHWGGFRVALHRVEFWQGSPSRLHSRLVYERTASGTYQFTRLYP